MVQKQENKLRMIVRSLGLVALSAFLLAPLSSSFAQYPGFGDPGSTRQGGGGDFVPVDQSVDGGNIPLGATGQIVVRFRNDSGQPIQTGLIKLYPSSTVSANVGLNQCGEGKLGPGAECAIALSVKALQAGPFRIEMLMKHSGTSRLVATTIGGSVESNGESSESLTSDIESIPEEIDFGSLEESQTLVEPVVLRNITSTPIDVSRIYIDSSEQAGYSLKSECESLEAGQACIAMVSWSPKLSGRSSGVLVIEHTGPTGLSSVPMKGEYDPADVEEADIFPTAVPGKGLLVSSQTQIDFGADVESASSITVSLVNAGDTDLALTDIKIAGDDNGVGFKEDGCRTGDILAPIEACPLTITWSPTRVGPLFDDVKVLHDGARGVLVIPVRGEALSTVSQDQRSIVLSDGPQVIGAGFDLPVPGSDVSNAEISEQRREAAEANTSRVQGLSAFAGATTANAKGVLDGYKITSFSADRAIINGPGGSRIVFNNEDMVLGGVLWGVSIQRDGIEFSHRGQRVLMLFDRSLSTINRVSASSSSESN